MKNKKFGLILALFLVNSAIALGDPFILALGNYLHNHFALVFPDGYMNTLHPTPPNLLLLKTQTPTSANSPLVNSSDPTYR